jgi:hypothetical protein
MISNLRYVYLLLPVKALEARRVETTLLFRERYALQRWVGCG